MASEWNGMVWNQNKLVIRLRISLSFEDGAKEEDRSGHQATKREYSQKTNYEPNREEIPVRRRQSKGAIVLSTIELPIHLCMCTGKAQENTLPRIYLVENLPRNVEAIEAERTGPSR